MSYCAFVAGTGESEWPPIKNMTPPLSSCKQQCGFSFSWSSMPKSKHVILALFQLSESIASVHNTNNYNNIGMEVFISLYHELTFLSRSFYFYIQVLDANKCFEKQCHSALSLQLAAYYYSLQIYSHLTPCFKNKNHSLYQVRMPCYCYVFWWLSERRGWGLCLIKIRSYLN